MKINKNSIIHGALILTLANIITRVIGFVYRIYMSKAIGAQGMGLYQLITPIYMLAWSISSAGLASTVSNLTARENAFKNYGNIKRILYISIFFTVLISLALSLVVYNKAEFISLYILKDIRTALSLKIISLCFPFMAAGSCIRGYFLGMRENRIPATSQVFEQLIRMLAVYLLSGSMIKKGLEYACAMAVWGMAIGEIMSFILVICCYYFYNSHIPQKVTTLGYSRCIAIIFSMAIPLTLNRIAGSLLSTTENILIPQRLQLYGYSKSQAVSIFGELCGMAMPLIMFPSSMLTALSTALMPVISSSHAKSDKIGISHTVNKAIQLTVIIGLGASGIFIAYPYEIGHIVYSQPEVGALLRFLALICPFIYLQVILSGILNGLNKQLFIFKIGLLSSGINIASIYFLTPRYGIHAFIFGWLIGSIITGVLSLYKVSSTIKIIPIKINIFIKIIFSISISVVASLIIYKGMLLYIDQTIAVIIGILLICIAYITMLSEMKIFKNK